MVEDEKDIRPLASAIYALGHLRNPEAIFLICRFVAHENAGVRHAAAFALGCFPDAETTIKPLIDLMSDADAEVRDWATFSLGTLGSFDNPAIREAFIQRLTDPDEGTKEEAVVGLAKRKNSACLAALRAMLAQPDHSSRALEAAQLYLGQDVLEHDKTACEYLSELL